MERFECLDCGEAFATLEATGEHTQETCEAFQHVGKKLTPEKARKILHDGAVKGKKLTARQRRYFGWVAGGRKRRRRRRKRVGAHTGSAGGNGAVRVRVVTWNMGSNKKLQQEWEEELKQPVWSLLNGHENYDVLFLALQEDWNGRRGKFGSALRSLLPEDEFDLRVEQTRGPPDILGRPFAVKTYVFMRRTLYNTPTDAKQLCLKSVPLGACAKATTGLAYTGMGNEFRLIFMGSHLPIDTKASDLGYGKRVQAVHDSLRSVFEPLKRTEDRYAAFWAGDMNFRINPDGTDQLQQAMTLGVFGPFQEQPIQFPPTCKMRTKNGGVCDRKRSDTSQKPECYETQTEKGKRTPSYCDRVLYASGGGMGVQPMTYNSYADPKSVQVSDHNMVYADFKVSI